MAEFLNDPAPPREDYGPDSGFDAMGKPVPTHRRSAAYRHCKEMGLDTEAAWSAVSGMAGCLERDMPYDAMAAGMKYVDLTGTYRLMAVLLTADDRT